jgi:hypothetical protein
MFVLLTKSSFISQHLLSHTRNSKHFMEPKNSLLYSQELIVCLQDDSGGVIATYGAQLISDDNLSKKCHINLGPIHNIYRVNVRIWKRTTVNCVRPSLT